MKQLILVRRDLKMGKGKMASQVAHASMGALMSCMVDMHNRWVLCKETNSDLAKWLEGSFTKVVLWVDSEEQLLKLATKAKTQGFINSLIKDNGTTEFNGVPTYTTAAIGPFSNDDYPEFCKGLKLA